MPTDTERREVARRLLELSGYVFCPDNTYELLTDALLVADFEGTDELFTRLADLIEPSEPEVKYVAEVKVDGWRLEELAHDAAVELTGIDREALLALADEMDAYSGHFSTGLQECTVQAWAVAIREALGAQDAAACGYFCHTAEDCEQSCDHCPSADVSDKTCSQVFVEDIAKRIKEPMKGGVE